ncbi:MAG: helix-turn-helix transcriptional regulator [Roseburia sp.]|nr:helix-turn-helix transcriptional regulator [Roseburia sp.]
MEKTSYSAARHCMNDTAKKQFSSGKYYVILYVSKGTGYFFIDNEWRLCGTEDMILLKPGEKTSFRARGEQYHPELLQLRVLPEFLAELSDEKTDLLASFQFAPQNIAVVHARSNLSMLIKSVITKLLDMPSDSTEYGHELYERNLISMGLVLFIRSCIDSDKVHRSHNRKNLLMDDLFRYIHLHLTEDLTLEQLEKEFFISRYHICREFKRTTGQTLHAYIVKSRLDLCRQYIEQGKPIREVYALGGFGGYNHFFRAFKKEYHMTPGEYYKSLKIDK